MALAGQCGNPCVAVGLRKNCFQRSNEYNGTDLELGPDEQVGPPAGLDEPRVALGVGVDVAVGARVDLGHFVLAHLGGSSWNTLRFES